MRRKDREVTDRNQIAAIMDSCDTCRLGLTDGQVPYIVPLSFGYEWPDGVTRRNAGKNLCLILVPILGFK